jgi:DNA-binding winged helix-turn-helix (wHTH) protein/tetratricopeptide (TPR) repeat protein
MDSSAQRPARIRFGSFELDAGVGELRESGRLRSLPAQPFRVLALLTDRAGEIVTRQEIRRCLWGNRKYVDVDRGINFCLNQIRNALRDPAGKSCYIKTLPRRGYRFIAPTTRIAALASAAPFVAVDSAELGSQVAPAGTVTPERTSVPSRFGGRRGMVLGIAATVVLASILISLAVRGLFYPHRTTAFTASDYIVIGDFTNTTGDAVLDHSLTHVLMTEVRQSPVLNVLPASKVRETLQMMGLADTQRLTPAVAREICLRTGSKAVLDGAISLLGGTYVVELDALACGGGDALASERGEAVRRENVLRELNAAASRVRARLGESLPSVRKFDVPLQATTTSLEALESYTIGIKVLKAQGDAPAVPFFKRALELDPNFAMAYAALASRYNNLDQPSLALDYATRAYEFRDKVTEPERLLITARYLRITGELEKLTQTFDMWKSVYPRDGRPYGGLGVNYIFMGQYSKAEVECQEALRLDPDDATAYANLSTVYLALNRTAEAQAILDSALTRHLDGVTLHRLLYSLAFLRGDAGEMQRQAEWAVGKPGSEDALSSAQSDTEAYFGRNASARHLSRRAIESAVRADYREAAALWQVTASLREAEFGGRRQATSQVREALGLAAGRNVKILAALALARAGDTAQAQALVTELERDYPNNSVLTVYRLPSIEAAIVLSEGKPRQALDLLETAKSNELGQPTPSGFAPLYPPYLRGQAYLALHDGAAAAVEFQKILDAKGVALNSPLAALARLQRARAAVLAGDTASALSGYQDFLALWAEADANVPVLIAARKEFAALHLRLSRADRHMVPTG